MALSQVKARFQKNCMKKGYSAVPKRPKVNETTAFAEAVTTSGDESEIYTKKRSTWLQGAMVIIGEIMGTGVLGLPKMVANLGMGLGIITLCFCSLCALYSGLLLGRVRNTLAFDSGIPGVEVVSYAEAVHELFGPRFGAFTEWAIVVNWAMVLPYYLMAMTNSMALALYMWRGLCYYTISLVAMLLLLPILQIKTLHGVSHLASLSTVAVVVVLVMVLTSIWLNPTEGTESTTDSRRQGVVGMEALAGIVFAFQGQSIFFEIMAEMKDSREFPKAVACSTVTMTLTYIATVFIAVSADGQSVSAFLPRAITESWVSSIINILLCFHILVSFLIVAQPFTAKLTAVVRTRTSYFSFLERFYGERAHNVIWFSVTALILSFSFLLANAIPFFADFQGIIGSAMGAPIMFFWPPLLYLRLQEQSGQSVSLLDRVLCRLMLYVLLPTISIAGLLVSVDQLVADWQNLGYPFQCKPLTFD